MNVDDKVMSYVTGCYFMLSTFIQKSFVVPETFESEYFYFVPLNNEVVEQDFEAVSSSILELQGIFGENSSWPNEDLTLSESRKHMKVHEQEFHLRQAFAYSVFDINKILCLGSIYIDPSQLDGVNSDVYFWIRTDHSHMELQLQSTIQRWLNSMLQFLDLDKKLIWL